MGSSGRGLAAWIVVAGGVLVLLAGPAACELATGVSTPIQALSAREFFIAGKKNSAPVIMPRHANLAFVALIAALRLRAIADAIAHNVVARTVFAWCARVVSVAYRRETRGRK